MPVRFRFVAARVDPGLTSPLRSILDTFPGPWTCAIDRIRGISSSIERIRVVPCGIERIRVVYMRDALGFRQAGLRRPRVSYESNVLPPYCGVYPPTVGQKGRLAVQPAASSPWLGKEAAPRLAHIFHACRGRGNHKKCRDSPTSVTPSHD